jgi:hypothetical protein
VDRPVTGLDRATTVRLTAAGADYHGLPSGTNGHIAGRHFPADTLAAVQAPPTYEVVFGGWGALPCLAAEIEPLREAP